MSFFIYENWTAEHKAVIHRDSCKCCNNGNGCHPNPLGNKNGKWHGPFTTLSVATTAARKTGRPVKQHRCV
jgi:hypothetical protein